MKKRRIGVAVSVTLVSLYISPACGGDSDTGSPDAGSNAAGSDASAGNQASAGEAGTGQAGMGEAGQSSEGGSGGTSSSGSPSSAGESAAGSTASGGAPDEPVVAECGDVMCEGLDIPFPNVSPLNACCPDGQDEPVCGLDSSGLSMFGISLDEPCQALGQESQPDPDGVCPDSPTVVEPTTMFGFNFPGCCRAESGTCGYLMDRIIGILEAGLGCVDSAPFLEDGETPARCGEGAAGAAGSAGASGAGGESAGGSSGSGGAP